ncbi:MAG: transglutaminase domain-containing protein [Oscillospiraceae bacterium]|nr:transglutaminase domain-containing protein [Oscillospiraceae bacterium]
MKYIHPDDDRIQMFVREISFGCYTLKEICRNLFSWFDENISYSRLNAPFFPLQRSDLDVLSMKCGTCGDFSNLLVSVFISLGYDVKYAYVHRDCYGDQQDHICAAVKLEERYILLDAANPYRKWHGYDCLHLEYEFLTVLEFESKITADQAYWTEQAWKRGKAPMAGLWYAPWIHSETVKQSEDCLDNVFFLLSVNDPSAPVLYAYYQHYTQKTGRNLILACTSGQEIRFHFSQYSDLDIWDDKQWSNGYLAKDIPIEYSSVELDILKNVIEITGSKLEPILHKLYEK